MEEFDLTSSHMKMALWSYFCSSHSGVDFEIELPGNAGRADCIALDILNREVTLVEIKRSRSDFRQGLSKFPDYRKTAHNCYVASPPGIVPHEEVPESWGILEFSENFGEVFLIRKSELQSCPGPFFDRYVKILLEKARDHKYFYHAAKKSYEKQIKKNETN